MSSLVDVKSTTVTTSTQTSPGLQEIHKPVQVITSIQTSPSYIE